MIHSRDPTLFGELGRVATWTNNLAACSLPDNAGLEAAEAALERMEEIERGLDEASLGSKRRSTSQYLQKRYLGDRALSIGTQGTTANWPSARSEPLAHAMAGMGHKLTFRGALGMSALPPKADALAGTQHVRL